MLGRLVNDWLRVQPSEYPWGDTLPYFRNADWRVCNLECVISNRGHELPQKIFHFRTEPKNTSVLMRARIDAVSLANNHMLDYGKEALSDTLQFLEGAGIHYAGAGMNQIEARKPIVTALGELSLGMIAFTDNEPGWEASGDEAGTYYLPVNLQDPRAKELIDLVKETKNRVDFLIVSAHWGGNWGYTPPPEQARLAKALIDAGADVIFGHSPHVFRGIEVHHGRPILYSAGDFIDDYAVDDIERNDYSFLFILELEGAVPSRLQLIPTIISNFQARVANSAEAEKIAGKMKALCLQRGTAADWNDRERALNIELERVEAGV